ncbi:MAG: nitroreductase [Chloroflexi bacterium]|nr:nitroreductase [Chloroflexota bacterium]
MELIEAIASRRSIRGFKPDPVPREVLAEVLELARLSPSAVNEQSWEFIVLTGESLERAKKVNVEQHLAGARVSPDCAATPPNLLKSPYVDRQIALAVQLFGLVGIERSNKEKRLEWQLKGKRFFDAPAAILISADETIFNPKHLTPLIDVGIITQTIALAALDFGLGTCIQQDTVFYPDALRKALNIPDSKRIIVALAMGYPDWDHPANGLRTPREPLESLVTWKT